MHRTQKLLFCHAGLDPESSAQFQHVAFLGTLERYGPFILIGLIIIGRSTDVSILGGLIWPFVEFF